MKEHTSRLASRSVESLWSLTVWMGGGVGWGGRGFEAGYSKSFGADVPLSEAPSNPSLTVGKGWR